MKKQRSKRTLQTPPAVVRLSLVTGIGIVLASFCVRRSASVAISLGSPRNEVNKFGKLCSLVVYSSDRCVMHFPSGRFPFASPLSIYEADNNTYVLIANVDCEKPNIFGTCPMIWYNDFDNIDEIFSDIPEPHDTLKSIWEYVEPLPE